MKILHDLDRNLATDQPLTLTIGNFDGFHLGHQAVIEALKSKHGLSAVITFDGHPSAVLRPEKAISSITTLPHKIALLEAAEVDYLYLLKFTPDFAQQSPEAFLTKVQSAIPFKTLLLGHDAAIGKDREGTFARIKEYGKTHHFETIKLAPLQLDGLPISSTRIREYIQKGSFSEATKLLGRPYSIKGEVLQGEGKGKALGFPTANLEVEGLCIPPQGVYAVQVKYNENTYKAIANLGTAPTLRKTPLLLLEIHLLDQQQDLYGKTIEVIFKKFIRAEQRFNSIEELSAQIKQDIQKAHNFLTY